LTLKLARIIARVVGNLSTNFGVSGIFFFLDLYLSDAPRDLITLTFDLGGHGE